MDIGSKREMLKIKIEQSRGEMQLLWERKMIIDTEVLAASIRLDALLNKYQSLQNR